MALTKMDPEVKERWLEALTSGRYKQEQNILRNPSGIGHCCLGVLCNVLDPDAWHGQIWTDRSVTDPAQPASSNWKLPTSTRERVGLDAGVQNKLMNHNDSGRSFKWIAAYIRRYL